MQSPFPVLTVLQLTSETLDHWRIPSLPDGFLGGSFPCLQEIIFDGVPFPALPTLLSSANNLVTLYLENMPWIGYVQVSLETMVLCLVTLTGLKTLHIDSPTPPSLSGRIFLPPETRGILPALTYFRFRSFTENLEDLVSRIDCPQLNRIAIHIKYTSGHDFRAAQLAEFVNRSDSLQPTLFSRLSISSRGNILFMADDMYLCPTSICISREEKPWQVSEITHQISQFSAILSYVDHLQIFDSGIDDGSWLPLLLTAVHTLYISEGLSERISLALDVTDVLPSLSLLCLENRPLSSVEKFVVVRRDSGRPVTIVEKTEFDTRVQSYLSE